MPVTLNLPTVSVTTGPGYATQVNLALTTLAAATHTGGANGDQWTAASLNIDGNVSWGGYSITALKAAAFTAQAANITDTYRIWAKTDGNLYYTNSSGTAVQITSSGTLNTSGLITSVYQQYSLSTGLTIGASDPYTHYKVDTSAARAITLPAANAVQPGRYYIFTDVTGSAASNNITISRAGSDTIEGGTSFVISRAYGSARLISDGTSKWSVITEHDATSSQKGVVALTGDFGGTAASPTVVSFTGSAGTLTMATALSNLQFASGASTPTFKVQSTASTTTTLYIEGQTATSGNTNGGSVVLTGGSDSGSGNGGSAYIASTLSGSYEYGVVVQAFDGPNRVTALQGVPTAKTDFGSGDKVIYIGNATTTPSGTPTGGGVLYVQSGALKYKGTSGTVTTIANA